MPIVVGSAGLGTVHAARGEEGFELQRDSGVIGAGELGLRPVFPSVLLPCLSSTQIQEEMHSCGIFLKSAFSWVTGAAE